MTMKAIDAFLAFRDDEGISNLDKIRSNQHVIRRVETTDKNKSYEDADEVVSAGDYPPGIVLEGDKLIGFGIHIFNEDVYPLKSFEIYFRNLGLAGSLDLSGMEDLVFIDVYHNRLSGIGLEGLKSLRILGIQDNRIEGIDATGNPLLRHLNATGNPMKEIRAFAPQREEQLPLELYAGEGGHVGMQFNPVYNAQWKETGEWQQTYYAYPEDGYSFTCWTENGEQISGEPVLDDEYGTSRILTAHFEYNKL